MFLGLNCNGLCLLLTINEYNLLVHIDVELQSQVGVQRPMIRNGKIFFEL